MIERELLLADIWVVEKRKQELASQLVRAACQVLEQRLSCGDISGRFIAEAYSLVREFMNQRDINKVCQNRDAIDKTLVDDLALGFYMTAVVQEEIKSCVTPEIIQCFRQAVLSVLRSPLPQSSGGA